MTLGRIILRPRGPVFGAQLVLTILIGASAVSAVNDRRWAWAALLSTLTAVLVVRCVLSGLAVVDQRQELVARTPFRTRRVQIADVDVAFFSRPLTRDGFVSKLVLRTTDGRRVRVAAISARVGPTATLSDLPPRLYMRKSSKAAIKGSLESLGIGFVDNEPT